MTTALPRRPAGMASAAPEGLIGRSAAAALAEHVCVLAATLWAAGTLGFEIAFALGTDLATLSVLTAILWVLLAASWIVLRARFGRGADPAASIPASPWPFAALLVLGAILPAIVFRPDLDDTYYLANVAHALAHPDAGITDEVRGLWAAPLEPFRSAHWATATAYDYLSAVLSHWSGLNYLDMRYFVLPAIAGAALVAGCFLMMREVTEREKDAALATFALILLYIAWRETHRDPGNFAFLRMFQAKAVVMTALLPGFAAFLWRFLRAPSIVTALALAIIGTAAAGMSASAVFLIGAVAVGVVAGAVAAEPRAAGPILIRAILAGLCCAVLAIPLFRALFDTLPLGADSPANRGWPATFMGHVRMMGKSTWALLVICLVLTALGTKGGVRRFVLGWTAAVIVCFANPATGQILIDHALGPNAYWRIFYALPWVPLAGLAFLTVLRRMPGWLQGSAAPALIGLLMAVALALTLGQSWREYGRQAVWPPSWKIDPKAVEEARAIAAVAPEGPMLSPLSVSPYLPLIDGSRPQLRMRTSGLEVWTMAAGAHEIADRRILATTALSGAASPVDDTRDARYLLSSGQPLDLDAQIAALSQVVAESRPISVVVRRDAAGYRQVTEVLAPLAYAPSGDAGPYEVWSLAGSR